MKGGASTLPRGLLLVLAIMAAIGTILFALARLRPTDRETGTVSREMEALEEEEPKIQRRSSVRPPLSSSHPLLPPPPRSSSRTASPELPDKPTTEPENPAGPYVSEDLKGLDDSYDPERVFAAAAREFQVPVDLLKAIAYVESQGNHRHGVWSEDGGFGVMKLREGPGQNTLEEAAQLLRTEKKVLVRDPVQNIRGAAVLIRSYYVEAVRSGSGPTPWMVAVTLYSGRPPEEAVRYGREIENILHEGLTHALENGRTLTINAKQDHLLSGNSTPLPAAAVATPPVQGEIH